jgi:hypothetical protein
VAVTAIGGGGRVIVVAALLQLLPLLVLVMVLRWPLPLLSLLCCW